MRPIASFLLPGDNGRDSVVQSMTWRALLSFFLLFFFFHSVVVGESLKLFRLLSLYFTFRYLLFVKKETDKWVVLFEKSRQNNWKVKISIT